MRYPLALLLFVFFSCVASAQTDSSFNIDSMLNADMQSFRELMQVTDKDKADLKKMLRKAPDAEDTKAFYYIVAAKYLESGSLDTAETMMKDITTRYPRHSIYGSAVVAIGDIALRRGDTAMAITIFENYVMDKSKDSLYREKTDMDGLWGDNNINNKSMACNHLIWTFQRKGQYREALKYMDMRRDKYPMYNFCGNGAMASIISEYSEYYNAYMHLNDTPSALRSQLAMLREDNKGLFYAGYYHDLHTLLFNIYSAEEIEKEVNAAANTIEIGEDKDKDSRNMYISLFGYRFVFDTQEKFSDDSSMRIPDSKVLEASRKRYLNSNFYQHIYQPQLPE